MNTARRARPADGTAVGSAAGARAHAEATVRAHWDSEGRTPHHQDMIDLSLVVSELVTHAIRHGAGLAGFDARTTGEVYGSPSTTTATSSPRPPAPCRTCTAAAVTAGPW